VSLKVIITFILGFALAFAAGWYLKRELASFRAVTGQAFWSAMSSVSAS
jgi:hypothetical protein